MSGNTSAFASVTTRTQVLSSFFRAFTQHDWLLSHNAQNEHFFEFPAVFNDFGTPRAQQ